MNFNRVSSFQIWNIFFIYSVFVSLAVQFVILPIIFPQHHFGDGLLNGGDWVFYHTAAVQASNEINLNGWSSWELRPSGFGIVGIVSAIYSFCDIYQPYVLIPLFSALHAIGALSIFMLIENIGGNRNIAFYSSIPFLIFPSSLLWVSQILKDSFAISGSLLVLYGLVSLFRVLKVEALRDQIKTQLFSVLFIMSGFLFIWLVRPYFIPIWLGYMLLVLFILDILLIMSFLNKKVSVWLVVSILIVQLSLIFSIQVLRGKAVQDESSHLEFRGKAVQDESSHLEFRGKAVQDESSHLEFRGKGVQDESSHLEFRGKGVQDESSHLEFRGKGVQDESSHLEFRDKSVQSDHLKYDYEEWISSNILPQRVDMALERLYSYRSYYYFVQKDSNSIIDYGRDLNSAWKMIEYTPRAMQVAFLFPSPSLWSAEHTTGRMPGMFHKIVGVEMIIIYVALTGFLYALYLWKRKIELWIIMTFSFYFALVPTYAFPNIGAIIRYRYAAIMLLVALGIAAFMYLYNKNTKISNKNNPDGLGVFDVEE